MKKYGNLLSHILHSLIQLDFFRLFTFLYPRTLIFSVVEKLLSEVVLGFGIRTILLSNRRLRISKLNKRQKKKKYVYNFV